MVLHLTRCCMDVVWSSVLNSISPPPWQIFLLRVDSVGNLVRAEQRRLLSVSQCWGPHVGLEGESGSHLHGCYQGRMGGLLTAAPSLLGFLTARDSTFPVGHLGDKCVSSSHVCSTPWPWVVSLVLRCVWWSSHRPAHGQECQGIWSRFKTASHMYAFSLFQCFASLVNFLGKFLHGRLARKGTFVCLYQAPKPWKRVPSVQ